MRGATEVLGSDFSTPSMPPVQFDLWRTSDSLLHVEALRHRVEENSKNLYFDLVIPSVL